MIILARLGIALSVLLGGPNTVDGFPSGVAYQWPGANYVYAHARSDAFKALWEVRRGDEIVFEGKTWTVYEYGPVQPWEITSLLAQDRPDRLILQTSLGPNRSYNEWIVRAMQRISYYNEGRLY